MATIKAVSSKATIGRVIDYVSKEEKTLSKLVSGLNCEAATCKDEMQATKELWGKTDGRTYKHFVQSFHKDEDITPEQAHEIAKQFAEKCKQFQGFEVLIATHEDRKHIHTHFVLNSVSCEDGHKFRMHKNELQQMKDLSDSLCRERGLSICEKGKTFEGAEREETSAYTKEAYQLLKKAEQGEVKSYVQDIALAVLDCKEQATSREDFIRKMSEKGYGVDWQDNHKYITFTDFVRQEQGEKQCKIRNNKLEKYYNMDFGKEELEHGFEVNARSNEERAEQRAITQRAREQLNSSAVAENRATGEANELDEARELIDHSRARRRNQGASERKSAEKRDDKLTQRADREAERERQSLEAQRRIEEAERKLAKERAERKARSHDRGWER